MRALASKEDDDGVKQSNQGERTNISQEVTLVFVITDNLAKDQPGDYSRREWDPQKGSNRGSHGGVIDRDVVLVMADDFGVKHGERRKQHDLQKRVEGHEDGAVIAVAAREIGPDEHHGDAARYADEDEPLSQILAVGEKRPCQADHEKRGHNPVEHKGDGDLGPEEASAEDEMQFLVADFAEDWIHHY